jgi:serine phosphatase RsbU (regulator of sigma subunit)
MRFYRQQNTDRLRGYRQYYYTNNKEYFKEAHRLYVEQHREKAREYSRIYYYNNKEYYKTLYESNKPKRLDTNRHNYTRIKEQKPDIYIARIRKNNARAILQRLARKLSYDYTVQALFNGWKYLIMRKVVKEIVVNF